MKAKKREFREPETVPAYCRTFFGQALTTDVFGLERTDYLTRGVVKVRIIRETDYKKLLRLARRAK